MSTFPSGNYTCEFESQQFVVNENTDPVAEISVNYSTEFISIEYDNEEFTVGIGDLELMSKDGYTLDNSVEVAGSSLDLASYFINFLPSGQLSYDLESIGEIRLAYENGTLKIYTQS